MKQPARTFLAAALLGCSVLSAAASGDRRPYDVVRDLGRLQDRIAAGDTVAEAAHAKAIERTAKAFADLPKNVWKDKRNTRALIVYLFSGGSAPEIEAAIPPESIEADLKPLYAGALAYGLGSDDEARTLLLPIDPKTVPNGLGGHLALVEASLAAESDPAKAIKLLDLARLLEPGTLVEEAALRKEISLIGTSGDLEKFALLSRRYLNAFQHSIYAENFRQLVAESAVQLGNADTPEAGARLGRLMAGLDRSEQRRLYLMIARKAVISGRIKMALLASEEAGHLSQDSKADEARAMIYFGAATIVGDRYDLGLEALSKVESAQLDRRDRALRASALAVADMIRSPAAADKPLDPRSNPQSEILADAERSLAAADGLLKGLLK